MAFNDPQSLTLAGAAVSLPRTSSADGSGAFTSNDGTAKLTVSNQYGKRIRRQARVSYSKVAPDPLIASQNIRYSASVYMVVDQPVTGFTVAELSDIVKAFSTWLSANTNANTTKLLGGEN